MILFLAIILATTASQAATDSNALSELPLEARQAVIKWNQKFKPFALSDFSDEVRELFTDDIKRVAPMKVVADFDGDQKDDYALLGEAGKQQFLIAVLSGDTREVLVIEKWSDPNFKKTKVDGVKTTAAAVPVYLTKAAGSLPESYARKNKREAIQLEAYLGAVELFKIEDGKVSELKP